MTKPSNMVFTVIVSVSELTDYQNKINSDILLCYQHGFLSSMSPIIIDLPHVYIIYRLVLDDPV